VHYKTRANVYMVLGRGVVGSCFGVRCCSYLGGGGFHVLVNLVVALVFGYVMPNLDFVGMLVPRIGGGSGVDCRPFVVILLPAGAVGFTRLFCVATAVSVERYLTGTVLPAQWLPV